ncbi:EAL domain-containing protein [Stenotrophomonas sp. SY1]|uniref:bifunctional diguanylate cyclase/phosphodiesterase n=1 Tax=Stenotrophomonas sp. SY1 TaxID=477235 RepID=UPI001E473BB8|nr:EAL domain-containing protein [Stenotrophomonas sp. SY1]MCD9087464.1 EAL domain-containing protein [Stenotrophomonas sp. SY1]
MATTASVATHAPRPTRGLHARLHQLILVTLLPLLIIGAIAIWLAARDYRQNSEQRLQETATALARGVDQGIQDNINQLRLLTMLAPQARESAPQLRAWARQNPDIELISDDTEQAHILPGVLLARARASGQPQVSDLFTTAASTTPKVAVALPFTDDQGQTRVLTLVQPSNRLISTILRSASEQSLLVAVVDGNGVIAARSRKPEQFIGQAVSGRDKLQQGSTPQGVFEAISKEGQPVVFAFHRLQAAPGWALVVGEPQTSFQARWQRPLAGIIVGGTLAAIIALLAANAIAGSILRPIRALAQRGHSIINNDLTLPDPPASDITEVRVLQDSFNDTIDALKKSADEAHALARELMTSEQRYRAVAEAGALVLWESGKHWQIRSATGWRELTGQPDEEALGRGWLQRVNEEDLPQIDAALEQSFSKGAPLDVEFRVLDLYGRWRWLRARGARIDTDQAEPSDWAGVLEDVDARRQAQARIAFLAQHDPLTALPNRVVLFDQLQHALATALRGHPSALLLLDLDRFKEVNDTLGHPSGDRLLQEVARRVLGCVRTNDLVARLGGDEFAILMAPEAHPPEAAMILAERLIATLSQPFDLEGHQLGIGTSIGIVLIDRQAETADKLMRNADLALYRAKEDGKGCYRFFEEEMDTRMQRRRQLETELRTGLQQLQFQLHYQPLVDLVQCRVTGFEALLRWDHPERGLLNPDQFLGLAEDIGLMVPLGDWILRQAMQDAMQWPEHMKVAVNLSVSQLAMPELASNIEQALADTGLAPSRLELEITENALVANIQAASAKLLRLKAAGVAIVMDDFGTGYSSLGYLRAFPFDKVKIDKSFIRDLGQQSQGSAIIGAVSHLCDKLGIIATIEGVETHDQLTQLRQEHCSEGQGYVFGRPMPQAQIEEFIRQWPERWG